MNYSFNQIGPTQGCRELVQGLKNNRCLQELDLRYYLLISSYSGRSFDNLISPQGCVILSRALTANKHLSKIKFARNPFQSAGCFALLTGVLKNRGSKLTELNFEARFAIDFTLLTTEDISVNDEFRILLDKSFKLLPSLRVIHGSKLTNNDLAIYSLKMYAPAGAPPKKWLIAMRQLQNRTRRPILPYLIEADADKDMKLSRWETTKALEVSLYLMFLTGNITNMVVLLM
ncbi:unnamed protein product [Taenia asiatica]|uniref:Uncharacterized protein n=1 Tax=Taenia asiatica TaxID=60517 RepID=A0A3P6RCH6_TAEAS|nr:unnamed protein product [Taenia asiatica]